VTQAGPSSRFSGAFEASDDDLRAWPRPDFSGNCCSVTLDQVPFFHEYRLRSAYDFSHHRWKTVLLFALMMLSLALSTYYFATQETTVDRIVADYAPGVSSR